MSEKISLFQRMWGVLHFLLCFIVVGLLVVYLIRDFRHGAPPVENPDATAQLPNAPIELNAPSVSIVSDAPVDLNVPAMSVVSDNTVQFEAPSGFIVSNAPVDLKVPAVSVVSDAPVDLNVSAISIASDAPVGLDVPGVSVVSDAPVGFDVSAISVVSNTPVDLKVPAMSVVSQAPVGFEVSAVSVVSDAPVDLKVSAVSVVSDAPIVFEVPAVSIVSTAPVVLETPAAPEEPEVPVLHDVYVAGLKNVAIRPESPVFQNLRIVTVKQTETTDPMVTIIGVDVASLQQTKAGDDKSGSVDKLQDFKFPTPELLTAFTDWQKATDDIAFAEKQLKLTQDHYKTAVDSLKRKVDLVEEDVKGGMEAAKTLDEVKAELSQKEFERQKEVLEAQAALQHARRDQTKFEKQLELAGFQSELLTAVEHDIDILMAEVPESMIAHIQVGQKCVARFFDHAGKEFHGKVHSVVPILSNEIRSFRVLLAVEDADDMLHTGMFAEIGLGVEPRRVLRIPPESVVSLDDSAYVLVRNGKIQDTEDTAWNVTEVQIGASQETGIEILSGIEDGQQIVGKGARLLKPVIAESLRL